MEAEEDEELREDFEVGSLKYRLADMEVNRWLEGLVRDKQQLSMFVESADGVTLARDAKLAELKKLSNTRSGTPAPTTELRKSKPPPMLAPRSPVGGVVAQVKTKIKSRSLRNPLRKLLAVSAIRQAAKGLRPLNSEIKPHAHARPCLGYVLHECDRP